jgi:hypothetical protein
MPWPLAVHCTSISRPNQQTTVKLLDLSGDTLGLWTRPKAAYELGPETRRDFPVFTELPKQEASDGSRLLASSRNYGRSTNRLLATNRRDGGDEASAAYVVIHPYLNDLKWHSTQ